MRSQILTITVLGVLIFAASPVVAEESHDFPIQLLDSSIVNISDLGDKPLIIEWGASWCGNCKANLKTMNGLYNEFKDEVTFLSINYGGSGDDLGGVSTLKNSGDQTYAWTFALDHTDYADQVGARNSHTWILNADLTIAETFGYGIRSTADLRNGLNAVLGNTDQISDTNDAVETFGLQDNPLLIGFGIVAIIGIAIVLIRSRTA